MTLFVSSFCLVFLLALQQQNVTHKYHGWTVLTSFLIAFAQVAFIKHTVTTDYWLSVMLLGSGGAIGASLSILFHTRFIHKNKTGEVA